MFIVCHNGLEPMWFYIVNIPSIFETSLGNMPILPALAFLLYEIFSYLKLLRTFKIKWAR